MEHLVSRGISESYAVKQAVEAGEPEAQRGHSGAVVKMARKRLSLRVLYYIYEQNSLNRGCGKVEILLLRWM